MGMSSEINGNNCFLTNNSLQMNETLLVSENCVQNMPQMMTAFNAFNSLDLNNSLIINTNDLSVGELPQQQILLMSSPMEQLMAVPQQQMMAKTAPTAVQMVLQTTEIPLITSGQPLGQPLSVIQVPTNLLLSDNNLIVIPQEGITLEVPTLDTGVVPQPVVNKSPTTLVYNCSPQLMAQPINCFNSDSNGDQLVVNINDCFAFNAVDDKSSDDNLNGNQYFQSNGHIFGIIDGNVNEPKLIANDLSVVSNDFNAFLASSLSPVECPPDPIEAKGWLNDSLIAYRAMKAFKKVMPNYKSNHTCPLLESNL